MLAHLSVLSFNNNVKLSRGVNDCKFPPNDLHSPRSLMHTLLPSGLVHE